MATDWKSASPEQIAARNQRRRERYKTLDSGSKNRLLVKSEEQYRKLTPEQRLERKQKRAKSLPTVTLTNPDGSVSQITNPDMITHLERTADRVAKHKSTFQKKLDRIQAWRDVGGLFPWPSLQDKAEVTCLWIQIALLIGRKCHRCGTEKCFDFSWRLTRKDDFLAFVPFTKQAYEKVLRTPFDYCLFCVCCAFDLRIYIFDHIFRDHTSDDPDGDATRYGSFTPIIKAMYPSDRSTLIERIKSGRLKSLTCGIRGPDGRFIDTFVRKNQFHSWIGLQPRDFSWHSMVQARELYARHNPSSQLDYWGIGRFSNDHLLAAENSGWDALNEQTKNFLREVPSNQQSQTT